MWRRICLGLLWQIAALAAVAAPPVAAQEVCLQLEIQLAALERQSSQEVYQILLQQYQQARAAYDQTYRQADQMGCLPRFLRLQLPASCGAVRVQLDRTLADLTQVQEQLRLADPNQSAAQRNSLLQALAANNCGTQYQQFGNQGGQIGGGALLDRLFGVPRGNDVIGNLLPLVTTYRTLCVRACDGYYFPISFSTTPAQFEADEATCQAQCPGAMLYVHRNPGEPVEDAVSVNGMPYTLLPNAFAFRESFNPECGCPPATIIVAEPGALFTPIGAEAAEIIANIAPTVPLPTPRPEPSEDPETLANRFGALIPGTFNLGAPPETAAVLVTGDGTRLIGPAYYYAR